MVALESGLRPVFFQSRVRMEAKIMSWLSTHTQTDTHLFVRTCSSGMTGPRAAHSPVYLVRGDGKTTGYGLTKLVMSQTGVVTSALDMTTLSSTMKLFHGNQTVRRCVRNGGLWNARVTEIAPAVTRSKLSQRQTERETHFSV